RPAELLRDGQTEQPELLHPLHDLVGELVAVLQLHRDRVDLILHPLPNGSHDRLLLVAQIDQAASGRLSRRHPPPPPVKSWSFFSLDMPAARPRAASCSAIFRLASSIISLPNMTAPMSWTSVAWAYAS